jgi:hypothetical protein
MSGVRLAALFVCVWVCVWQAAGSLGYNSARLLSSLSVERQVNWWQMDSLSTASLCHMVEREMYACQVAFPVSLVPTVLKGAVGALRSDYSSNNPHPPN